MHGTAWLICMQTCISMQPGSSLREATRDKPKEGVENDTRNLANGDAIQIWTVLTTMQIMSAAGVVAYFGRELSTSEYYTAEHGVWCGKGAERLGLPSDLIKEDFVAIANNRIPPGLQLGPTTSAQTSCGNLKRKLRAGSRIKKRLIIGVSASISRSRFQRALACTWPKPRMRKSRN